MWDIEEKKAAAEAVQLSRRAGEISPEQSNLEFRCESVVAGKARSAIHQMFSYGDPTAHAAAIVGGKLLSGTGQHFYCVGR